MISEALRGRLRYCVPLAALIGLHVPSLAHATPQSAAADSTIRVDASIVKNRITPYMTGSCIEDVNHEIYGGLYAQRIFGESFEEPPVSLTPVRGWTAYGGVWKLEPKSGELHVDANAGTKLLANDLEIADGEVSCDIRLSDTAGTNAAMLVRVTDPHVGPDNWNGYEIAISASGKNLTIHRHHHDWHLLKTVPAVVTVGQWVHIRTVMVGKRISIYMDSAATPALEYTDTEDALLAGAVGIRTWNSDATFRNVAAGKSGKPTQAIPLAAAEAQDEVSGMWDRVQTGAASGKFLWDASNPYNTAHSQRIEFAGSGAGTVGVANRGLNRWGIAVRSGQKFAGRVYLRAMDYPGAVTVGLQSVDGSKSYATATVKGLTKSWKRFDFSLVSSATDANARFVITIDRPGVIWADQVSLMLTGADLYRGLPVRADIVNGIKKQGIHFLRYGGTMVNAPTYRWKSMIGDRDLRPQVAGNWYAQSTNGFAIEEFVQVCEAAGIEPAFAIDIDETPEAMAEMVEYLNGPADSPWGSKRAANGHVRPYGVRYIEIGNEEAIDGSKDWYRKYLERFLLLEPAMHAKDPNLQLVIAAWWRPVEPLCQEIATRLNGKAALWDVHVGGDGLRDGEEVERVMTTMQARLQQWAPGTKLKAVIFEENGGRHDLQRALGHAAIVNTTERHGDFVLVDCPANCLQPWLQNDNGWDQGLLFFTSDRVWGMPPFYAQEMASQNYLPLCVQCEARSPLRDLDVTATMSTDRKSLVLKIVNIGSSAHTARIDISGFKAKQTRAKKWTLSGSLTDVNSPTDPTHITSRTGDIAAGNSFEATVDPYSYTIIRMQ